MRFKSLKYIIIITTFIIIGFLSLHFDTVLYLLRQGKGQFKVITGKVPITEVLKNDTINTEIKQKLKIVGKVKRFVENELGLKKTDNYTTYYHHNEPLMWVLTACKPYELKAKTWEFPFFGSFPYLGFFDKDVAIAEKNKLQELGFDTGLRNPSAWSTLGWFIDPIYSAQLDYTIAYLIETVVYESVHSTIFVDDSIAFNENLASFIGVEGAKLYLESTNEQKALKEYSKSIEESKNLQAFIIKKAKELDSVYSSKTFLELDIKNKSSKKKRFMEEFYDNYLCLKNINHSSQRSLNKLNNTFFMSYLRYHKQENDIRFLFNTKFGNDLRAMINYYISKYKVGD